ncbi:MAG TPA: oligosaccharide flippase family protein [Allosphingosinicella sp.]|nr:oligosaccharide flippase family protein [Allosphingosinicella sp.]
MSLSRNATYNIIGAALPSLLTLVTVPLYLHIVGVERYGVLALCWVFLNYSSFMDFGLGLAVAHRIAKSRPGEDEAAGHAFWTAVWLSLAAGAVATAAVYAAGTFYFGSMAKVDPTFRGEVAAAVPVMAAMVPAVMLGGVLGGVLQGRERFLAFNAAGLLSNTLLAVLPLTLAVLWSPALPVLVAGALAARLAPIPWLYHLCRKAVPLHGVRAPSRAAARGLLGFGGWVSLTTIANTVIGTADRLAIGGAIGAAAVSVYSISLNVVSRVMLIPHSLAPALFPRLSALAKRDRDVLVLHGIQTVAAIVTPVLIGVVILVEPFFTLWIGRRLAVEAVPLAYLFAVGFWFYCVGYLAMSLLQASGRPDLVSKVIAAEVVPFIAGLIVALSLFGLPGAAMVYSLRAIVEALALLLLARVPWPALRSLLPPLALTLAAVAVAHESGGLTEYAVLALLLAAALAWSWIHAPQVVRDRVGRVAPFLTGLRAGR